MSTPELQKRFAVLLRFKKLGLVSTSLFQVKKFNKCIIAKPAYAMRSSKMSLKSQTMIFCFFWHFLLGYCLGFNLVKIPQRWGNWFQRYKQLKDWTNNKKQKKLSALFGCILKTVFASSDSFCLITSLKGTGHDICWSGKPIYYIQKQGNKHIFQNK